MAFNDIYNLLFDKIKTDLKTITGLADDGSRERVLTEHGNIGNKTGEYSIVLQTGPVEDLGGVTTQSNLYEFTVIADLSYFGTDHHASKTAILSMIDKIFDKFNLTNLGGLVRICKVTVFPEDANDTNLFTGFARLLLKCEKTVYKA